ncbi:UNVERIFIED_ORG: NAD(P)H dehydrogenase (quinone) [Burkholderia sp. CF145]|jgi:NAD(P)H dehydrogenase (quinone)|uniref:NAD(P)H-dependent oxidoreductase n=1 Tax=Paraburkholderia hospita TaxID=169430 RepID=UPI0002717AE0|nr:NAD(P)H-dependent oxidoreductase [Paraburkholderia hospita]EUC14961.1 Ribosyldihydronicotinamide dehydrogenase (quinone) [Burkholderia sp. BT03]SKD03221.1 Putative NADPH-quinone reductase (modulator of drug activity B) [Paraburkholderia hospita]
MKVLIVFAHPEPKSFNGALKDTAVATLEALGHEVQVSDLYKLNWRADLNVDDFTGDRLNDDFLDLSVEQEHMFTTSTPPTPDVHAEQQKVLWCDMVIFQYPMWWFGMPAILKGWVDRVMTRGFAYATGRKYDTGMFNGKKAMVSTTTGTASSLYEPDGVDGAINHILWPIHNGIFRYLGFDVLPPHVSWMPSRVSADERQAYLDSYATRLRQIENTEPLYFHPFADYGPDQRLKPGVIARSGFQWNPGAGQAHDDAADEFTRKVASAG